MAGGEGKQVLTGLQAKKQAAAKANATAIARIGVGKYLQKKICKEGRGERSWVIGAAESGAMEVCDAKRAEFAV